MPIQVALGLSFVMSFLPAVVAVLRGELTAFQVYSVPGGLIYAGLIAVSWKPVVTYYRVCQRARRIHDDTEAMADRALWLRDVARAQQAAVTAAGDLTAKANAARAYEATLTELEELVDLLEPRSALVGNVLAEVDALSAALPHRRAAAWFRRSLVADLTGLAVAIAGARGARMRDTWMADLAGIPEEGLTLSRSQQVWHATGFVVAAFRMRGRVISEPLWRPVDWLLSSESRVRTSITLVVGAQVIYIAKVDGLYGLITEGWGWCGACALALTFLSRWLRKVRGVELATTEQSSDDL